MLYPPPSVSGELLPGGRDSSSYDSGAVRSLRPKGPAARTESKYREAVGLYGSTALSLRAICVRCGVSYAGLRSYLYKYRRDLLLSRHGVAVPSAS